MIKPVEFSRFQPDIQDGANVNFDTIYGLVGSMVSNVSTFGAKGDGVTDDTAAIQAALTAGGTIFFPAGTFLVSASLYYVSNSFIYGAGRGITIIKVKSGTTLGNAWGVFVPTGYGVLSHVTSVTFAHLTINGNKTNCFGNFDGFSLVGTANGIIYDCESHDCRECGFVVDAQSLTPFTTLEYSQIIGCYAWNNTEDGFQVGKTIISHCNAYDNTGNGIRYAGAGSTEGLDYFCIINGNVCNHNTGTGIQIEEQAGGNISPVVISNNLVSYNLTNGIATNIKGTRIYNNIVQYNGVGTADHRTGIYIAQDKCAVIGNLVRNNNDIAIGIFNNRADLDIAHNVCYDDRASKIQAYAVKDNSYAIGSNNSIHDNKFVGNLTEGILAAFYTRADYKVYNNDTDFSSDWTQVNETWTYASASTITVPSDATLRYAKGDKIRITQSTGGTKYFYIAAVASTTLTIAVTTDYTLGNQAITAPSFSKLSEPLGFPNWFNYTPVYTGFTGAVTTNISMYQIVGTACHLVVDCSGTSNAVGFTFTAPITNALGVGQDNLLVVIDNGTWQTGPGIAQFAASSTTVNVGITPATITGAAYAGFTNSGTKGAKGEFIYKI